MHKLAILAGALALAACSSLTSQERQDTATAVFAVLKARVADLQTYDVAKIKTDPAVRIAASTGCDLLALAIPLAVSKINDGETDLPVENQATVEEAIAIQQGFCELLRTVLVEKDTAAPETAPLPVEKPATGSAG